ncbi:MAG: NAD-binding protein [Oscillospiraceae bacterium]
MSILKRDKQENIVIAGCGNIVSYLVSTLCEQTDNISVIDADGECFTALKTSSIKSYINGEATDIDVLETAGIKFADVVVAATNNDNANVMIAQIAKKYYKVNTVVAIIEDLAKGDLCRDIGIVTISPLMLSINQLQLILANEKK